MRSLPYTIAALSALGCEMPVAAQETATDERPNFVWFMAEDVSSYFMELYNNGQGGAIAPHVAELARGGVVFNQAYCNAPVSSAARSTLITGCYAPRLGVQLHRKIEAVPMPEGLHMFPYYLRQAGYHTSNAAKTDYNCFLDKEAWDIVSGKIGAWRERPDKGMPFFHVRTNAMTHESSLHFPKERMHKKQPSTPLSAINLLPMHPDTELFRYTYATFYDRIRKSDSELGRLISMLREDGELDNTFIFYFGDNGGSLPGSKGYTTETGLHVPLIVYIPEKWRDKIPLPVGSRTDGIVSFMDFGPTLLHLAGIDVPEQMDGAPFLGEDITMKQLNKRDKVYCYGDRFDELYAFNRTVRKGNFKYSRNFLPYHPKSLYAAYRYRQAAFREWKQMFEAGKLNAKQSRFFQPQGAEELYDLSVDPYETNNLAGKAAYQKELSEMRTLLMENMVSQCDLGIYPECAWLSYGQSNPTAFGKANQKAIQHYLNIANLELESHRKPAHRKMVTQALQAEDPVERYWGATVCAFWGKEAAFARKALQRLTENQETYVASRAIVALSIMEGKALSGQIIHLLERSAGQAEMLQILNDMVFLKETFPDSDFSLSTTTLKDKTLSQEVTWRLKYIE